jgi:ATP-dependent DNA helicase RecG
MPDYDVSENQVSVTVYGKRLDINYTRLLFDNPDFDLNIAFLLDQVQKGKKISAEESRKLRKMKLIEGKMLSLYLASNVALLLDEQDRYIKNKAFDNQYYKDLIVSYLKEFKKAQKKDIVKLVTPKLSDVLDDSQKEYKVQYLLRSLKNDKIIILDSENKRTGSWVLVNHD